MKRKTSQLIALLLIGSLSLGSPATAQTPPLPKRMAAIGDSITMGTMSVASTGTAPVIHGVSAGTPTIPYVATTSVSSRASH